MTSSTAKGRLPVKTKLGYGVADVGVQILLTGTGLYLLNFLTDVALLGAALAGTAIFISKFWDAISDPLMGIISDRTKSRWGRRLPYLLFGAFPFGFSFFLVFINPHITNQTLLFLYAIVTYIFLCTAYTVVTIPYLSILPELTKDFNEKTSIVGYKSIFTILGALIAGGALMPVVATFKDKSTGYMAMGAIFGVVAALVTLVPFFTLKKLPMFETEAEHFSIKDTLKLCFKNKPFLNILASYLLVMFAVSILMSMLIYYIIYWLEMPATYMAPVFLILMITAAIFLPLWVKMGEKIGKKAAYILGMSFLIVGMMITFFVPQDKIYWLYAAVFIVGIGFSTNYVFPHTILPDTIEYDEFLTGKRREGIYYGMFQFIQKFGFALGVFVSGWGIKIAGYVPNVPQSPKTLFGIRLLFGPISAFLVLASLIVLLFYPINAEKYEEILSGIEKRKKSNNTTS